MRWGLQSGVNGRHMLLSSLTLTLFLCVCVTEAEERNVKSVFLVCTLKEKVCAGVSHSLFATFKGKSEICLIQSGVSDPTPDLCR